MEKCRTVKLIELDFFFLRLKSMTEQTKHDTSEPRMIRKQLRKTKRDKRI